MDPAKLKVVELRAELQARGLDSKGNKPVLVKRLKEALEAELETELPDTSIVDTSTEDVGLQDNTSDLQSPEAEHPIQICPAAPEGYEPATDLPDSDAQPAPQEDEEEEEEEKVVVPAEEDQEPVEEVPDSAPAVEELAEESATVEETVPESKEPETNEEEKASASIENEPLIESDKSNGDTTEQEDGDSKNRKSRWTEAESTEEQAEVEKAAAESTTVNDAEKTEKKEQTGGEEESMECEQSAKGEKRKHSKSPERSNQRKCSRSPVREDEPAIDSNQVQLSWYDSDLHLLIDKTNFLSAKPLNEGLFSYVWSGARLTHGVCCSAATPTKVCFDVKITDELKFDNFLNVPSSRGSSGRDRKERNGKESRDRSKSKSETNDNIIVVKSNAPSEKKSDDDDHGKTKDADEKDAAEPMQVEQNNEDAAGDSPQEDKTDGQNAKELSDKEKDKDKDKESCSDSASVSHDSVHEDKSQKVAPHLIRIGWSTAKSSLQLGEDVDSYALESSGKFFHNCNVINTDAEAKFGKGDVVRAYLDAAERRMAFAVNGKIVFSHQFETDDDDICLFPHILTRNYAFEVNPSSVEEPWCEHAEDYADYQFIASVDDKCKGVESPKTREECEVIVMVGLPAAGKTFWVNDYLKTNNDKPYHVIGNTFLARRLTVDGEPLEKNICSDRVSQYYDKLGKSVNRLCELASLRRRDFILDQTNVFPTAIRRKMRSFAGFKRHAVVIVNDDDEQAKRVKLQEAETGKGNPDSAVLEMKADMGLPKVGDIVEKITFVSLQEDEANSQVQKYNNQGKAAGFGNIGYNRRDHRDNRGYNSSNWNWNRGRRDSRPYRDRYYDNRYQNPHRQSRFNRPQWTPRNHDKRDNRAPRDWHSQNRIQDSRSSRVNRDYRSHGGGSSSGNSSGNYRHRSGGGGGGGGGSSHRSWSGGQSAWASQTGGSWGSSSGSSQNHDNYATGWNQSQGSWNQNQWKYGGGGGGGGSSSGGGGYGSQSGYTQYPSWNYYGQYAQDWTSSSSQASGGQARAVAGSAAEGVNQQLSHLNSQDQAMWAQYAQRYNQNSTSQTSGADPNQS